jgi:hypothetical protein
MFEGGVTPKSISENHTPIDAYVVGLFLATSVEWVSKTDTNPGI